jgi:hypothetical protein
MDTKKRPVDWVGVNYMVCDVQYGGRITDDWDRRLFNTYGKSWLTQQCVDPSFEFYTDALSAFKYAIPGTGQPGNDVETFRKYIDTLPLIDNPEIFGLHANADLAFRTSQTSDVLNTVLDIQPKEGGGGGGETREDVVLRMVDDLQKKLPPDYRADDVAAGIKALGGMGKPLNICLKQEIDRLQKVLRAVRTTLANLKLAIAGTVVMSPELAEALDALFMARVPPAWTKASQLVSPNMGVWFVNILKRAEQFTGWLRNGRPTCFWLTGFFNATGFLTANRQEARTRARGGGVGKGTRRESRTRGAGALTRLPARLAGVPQARKGVVGAGRCARPEARVEPALARPSSRRPVRVHSPAALRPPRAGGQLLRGTLAPTAREERGDCGQGGRGVGWGAGVAEWVRVREVAATATAPTPPTPLRCDRCARRSATTSERVPVRGSPLPPSPLALPSRARPDAARAP